MNNKFIGTSLCISLFIIIACLGMAVVSTDRILYFYIIIYVLLILFLIIKERKNIINIKVIYSLVYTIMIGIAPVVFYFYNGFSLIANTGNSIEYQFPMILFGLVSLIIGFYVSNIKIIRNKIEEKKNVYLENSNLGELEFSRRFSILLLIISMVANIYFILSNINVLLGGHLAADSISIVSSNGKILALSGLYLLGIGMLYNYYLNTKKNLKLLIFFIVINIIFFIIRGSRTPIIMIFIYMIMIRNSYFPIKVKNMAKIAITILVAIGVLGVIRSNMSNYKTTFLDTISIELEVGSINLNYIYKTFPKKIDFQKGYSYLINIIMLRPGSDDDFTIWLKKAIGLTFSGGGVTPTLIGEGYLNFGYLGVFLIPFLVGVTTNRLNYAYLKRKKNIVWTTYIVVKLLDIFRGGIGNSEVTIIIFIIMFIIYKFTYKLKKIKE